MAILHDMHCHLDFMANGEEVARCAGANGTLLFANTVTPEGWMHAKERFAPFRNTTVGFGMHPWWVDQASSETDGECQRSEVLASLEEHNPRIIGEIGLDLGRRHAESRGAQLDMFSSIVSWCARETGKLISIHSVHAAREALDILESSGAFDSCTCLFHWFTGPSDQLKRAVSNGCYFSCGPRMLATGKGREYVKAIPAKQLLLETDAPPEQGVAYSYEELHADLESVAQSIAAIKGTSALETIEQTSRTLLS